MTFVRDMLQLVDRRGRLGAIERDETVVLNEKNRVKKVFAAWRSPYSLVIWIDVDFRIENRAEVRKTLDQIFASHVRS